MTGSYLRILETIFTSLLLLYSFLYYNSNIRITKVINKTKISKTNLLTRNLYFIRRYMYSHRTKRPLANLISRASKCGSFVWTVSMQIITLLILGANRQCSKSMQYSVISFTPETQVTIHHLCDTVAWAKCKSCNAFYIVFIYNKLLLFRISWTLLFYYYFYDTLLLWYKDTIAISYLHEQAQALRRLLTSLDGRIL